MDDRAMLPSIERVTHVECTQIYDADHDLLADNPAAVADLIEQRAGSGTW
jgi:hypothetical protein